MKTFIIPISAENIAGKIQHPFMTKIISKLGIEGMFLIEKLIYKKSIAKSTLNGEILMTSLLNYGTKQKYPLLPLLFNIALDAKIINKKK